MKLPRDLEWRSSVYLDRAHLGRTVWLYAYSWLEVRRMTVAEYLESDAQHEFSHFCFAPGDTDGNYLLATGHYAWANGLEQ